LVWWLSRRLEHANGRASPGLGSATQTPSCFTFCANARRRKNHIPLLSVGDRQCSAHDDREAALHSLFFAHLGQPPIHQHTLNWEALHLQQHDLSHLNDDLSECEVEQAIHQMPSEKAPGPDGYIGAFFKQCWSIVKCDVV
jgi:hypothetical protein